jgi:LPXTG-motif cell wall-anchored protein
VKRKIAAFGAIVAALATVLLVGLSQSVSAATGTEDPTTSTLTDEATPTVEEPVPAQPEAEPESGVKPTYPGDDTCEHGPTVLSRNGEGDANCKPRPRIFLRIKAFDCDGDVQASAKLSVKSTRPLHESAVFGYEGSDGQGGILVLEKGDTYESRTLTFNEDAASGLVEITLVGEGQRTHAQVVTDCAENETPSPTSDTTTNPVGNVANPQPPTVAEEGLASTGTSDTLPIVLVIGFGLLLGGGLVVFLSRHRSRRSGDHRP